MPGKSFNAINDVHVHITVSSMTPYNYPFEQFISDKKQYGISAAVVFINPLRRDLYGCERDHTIAVRDTTDNYVRFICQNCGKILYQGYDPYILDNEVLLDKCQNIKGVFPFIYLPITSGILRRSTEYYAERHGGKFFGWKLHPNLSMASAKRLDSDLPVIIHSGINEYDSPLRAIEFANNYEGKVCIAHWARMNRDVLKLIRKMKNVYIDMSPTYFLNTITCGQCKKVYWSDELRGKNEAQIIEWVVDLVGEDKVLFGSDVPWGKYSELLENKSCFNAIKPYLFSKLLVTNFHNFMGFAS
jgi:hypothetical protein